MIRNVNRVKARLPVAPVNAAGKRAGQRIGRLNKKVAPCYGGYFFNRPFFTRNAPSASLNSRGFSIIMKWPTPSHI